MQLSYLTLAYSQTKHILSAGTRAFFSREVNALIRFFRQLQAANKPFSFINTS